MPIVYRVQNDDGYGPYGCNAFKTGVTSSDWARDTDPFHENHPCPYEDGIDRHPPSWLCGFDSLDKLLEWFTKEEINNLEALGFNVYEIHLDEDTYGIVYGDMQLIFDPYQIHDQYIWRN